jgi:hypothetical protein
VYCSPIQSYIPTADFNLGGCILDVHPDADLSEKMALCRYLVPELIEVVLNNFICQTLDEYVIETGTEFPARPGYDASGIVSSIASVEGLILADERRFLSALASVSFAPDCANVFVTPGATKRIAIKINKYPSLRGEAVFLKNSSFSLIYFSEGVLWKVKLDYKIRFKRFVYRR